MISPDRLSSSEITSKLPTRVFSRRQVLKLIAGSTLAIACESKQHSAPAIITKTTEKPNTPGVWTLDSVKAIAESMVNEPFNDISNAGGILLDNQNGKPSWSQVSPVFNNSRIQLTSVDKVLSPQRSLTSSEPVAAIFRTAQTKTSATLRSRKTGELRTISVPTGLEFTEIQLNNRLFQEHSDFFIRFYLSLGVQHAQALGMVTSWLLKIHDQEYLTSSDAMVRKAVQASLFSTMIGEISPSQMAYFWAHNLLIPNYLEANTQGRFADRDKRGHELKYFDLAADVFRREGVLVQQQDGKYGWTSDYDKFYGSWMNFSTATWLMLQPPK